MDAVQTVPYRRVYVWELPVRIYHWINALVIVLLGVTGYMIGNPQALFSADEAYQLYWFGWIRFVHFAAAYIYFFNFLFRLYWGFVGNKYARWNRFIPTRKRQFKDLTEVIKVDVLESQVHGRISVGHNVLAGLSYFMTFLVFVLQAITGFALYSSMSEGFLPRFFVWAVPLFGGDAAVRQWHHILMWFFVVFVIVHIYLVFYHDYVEGRGTTSSIIGGWKFVRDDEIKK